MFMAVAVLLGFACFGFSFFFFFCCVCVNDSVI